MKESASAQRRHGGTWRQERKREHRPSHGTISHFKSECLSSLVDRALIRPLIKAETSHSENNGFFFLLLSPLLNFSVSFTSMGLQVVQSPVVLSCWSYAGEQTLYSARLVLRDERWGRKEKKEREKELQSGSE